MERRKKAGAMVLRLRCCRCGRVERRVAPASAALVLADDLLSAPCPGAGGARCASRDRRLELWAENSA